MKNRNKKIYSSWPAGVQLITKNQDATQDKRLALACFFRRPSDHRRLSCAVNPVTQKREFMLLSPSDELSLGQQTNTEIIGMYGVYQDAALNEYISTVGQSWFQSVISLTCLSTFRSWTVRWSMLLLFPAVMFMSPGEFWLISMMRLNWPERLAMKSDMSPPGTVPSSIPGSGRSDWIKHRGSDVQNCSEICGAG
jgi:hypothetical protein